MRLHRRLQRAVARGATLPLVVVLALAVAGYSHLLGSDGIVASPHSDLITQHYASLVQQNVRGASGGGFPFWRSDQFSGYPHFSNPQSFTTHPLYALYYFVSPRHGLNLVLWLHLLTAGLCFYFAGSILGLSRAASLVMAAAGLFNFKLILMIYAGLLPLLPSVVLLPLYVALAVALLRSASVARSIALGVCAAVCLLAGHFQILYYATTILAGLALWELGRSVFGGDFRRLASQVKYLALSVAVCLGLAAFKYVPFLLEMRLLSRADISHQEFLFRDALEARHLLTLLHPEILGTPLDGTYPENELWEDALYFGVAPLLLALVGFAIPVPGAKDGRLRAFALFGFLASLTLAFNTPLQELMFERFPGFGLFRIPGRYFHLTALFGILLAGDAVDRLRALFTRRGVAGGHRMSFFIGALVVVIALEGGYYGKRYLTTVALEDVFPATAYGELLASLEPGRVAPLVRATLNYGWAAPMGLELVTGYDSYNLAHYREYMDLVQLGEVIDDRSWVWCDLTAIRRLDLLDALSVRYLVTPFAIGRPGDRWRLAATLPQQPVFVFYRGMARQDLHVYENRAALPRAYLARRVAVVGDGAEMIRRVAAGELGRDAIVLGADPSLRPPPGDGGSVRVLRQRDGHLSIEVETERGGLLVVSEVWHPGWRAEIVGRDAEVPVHRTNVSLMSLEVPAGRSLVSLEFRPPGWGAGMATSVATLALVALLVSRRVGSRSFGEDR